MCQKLTESLSQTKQSMCTFLDCAACVYVCYQPCVWNRRRPSMLITRPTPPTYSRFVASVIDSRDISLSVASTRIVKHRANKNTAFINAPTTSARAQPYVLFLEQPLLANCNNYIKHNFLNLVLEFSYLQIKFKPLII